MSKGKITSGLFSDMCRRIYGTDPKVITFIVTHDCSMRCTYCYECNKSSDSMSIEVAKKAVDLLFEEDRKQSKFINKDNAQVALLEFIGGEPLIEIDLIDSIVQYFLSKALAEKHRWALDYMISICSNGLTYRTKRVQDFLKKYNGRVSINITVDGCKECHDACRVDTSGRPTYDRVVKSIKSSKEKFTKFTLSPENVHYLYEASINLYENLNMEGIFCNCIFEEGWELENAKILYKEMIKLADYLIDHPDLGNSLYDERLGQPLSEEDNNNWCGGDGKMMAFDIDGKIYPCLRYAPLSTTRDPFIIGDVDNGLLSTEDQREHMRVLDGITRRSQSTDECWNCPIASGCAWCSAHNYDVFGTPDKRATFICIMHRARVLANTYYWNEYYKRNNIDREFKLNMPKEWIDEILN